MKELWELCRKLHNPKRLELLMMIYTYYHRGGLGVNEAVDTGTLGQAASSLYLKHLEELGLVRRERGGRYVGYHADWSRAPVAIGEIAKLLYDRFNSKHDEWQHLTTAFGALGNAFRLRAIKLIATKGPISKETLADLYNKEMRIITRDLEPAVKSGLISIDSDDNDGMYHYIPQSDDIVSRVIELAD